jgi:glutathione S-transferase
MGAEIYTLYNVKCWGSLAVHLLLDELDVPYRNVWMTPEQVKSPDFRQLSPLGLIPALGLADGRTMIESAAMVSFLTTAHADKSMGPQPGTLNHAMFLSWLHFMSTNMYASVDVAAGGDAWGLEKLNREHGIVNAHLQKHGPFMLGASFSALDLYLFMLTIWGKPKEHAILDAYPAVANVSQHVRRRPLLAAALKAHGVDQVGAYG